MDRRLARNALSIALASLLLSVGVASAAPSGGGPKCNPHKTVCPVSSPTTTTTVAPTSTTSTSTTTTAPPADTTPPTASITSPTSGSAVTGSVAVSGASSDDRTVAGVDVSVDGGAWTAASGTTSWSRSVDTAAWPAGSAHSVAARAVDGSGNISVSATVSVQKAASSTGGGDPSVAPATQGTWVSPEGVTIEVTTAGAWTVRDIYRMLLENASTPGDFAQIAPTLTVKVQDQTSSSTVTSTSSSGGIYTGFDAYVYLKGVSSTFASQPDAQLAHEYGHVWTLYHQGMTQQGDWSSYLDFRWANAGGSVRLAGDSRLDSTYVWDKAEIIADDYRLLFGSSAAISERPAHLNSYIPVPSDVPGLRDFFLATWAG